LSHSSSCALVQLIGRLDASDSDKNGAVCDTPINDVTEALRTHWREDNYISVTRMQIDAQEWEALKSVHRRAIVMVKMGGDEGGLRFDPSVVTIRAGDMIEFINNRRFPHNIVFDEDAVPAGVDASAISRDDLFNAPGEVYQVMLTVPGTYGYYCEPHQGAGMQGQIIVTL
jgi:plastocyanin